MGSGCEPALLAQGSLEKLHEALAQLGRGQGTTSGLPPEPAGAEPAGAEPCALPVGQPSARSWLDSDSCSQLSGAEQDPAVSHHFPYHLPVTGEVIKWHLPSLTR